jgi:hypothetical protein
MYIGLEFIYIEIPTRFEQVEAIVGVEEMSCMHLIFTEY